MIYMLANNDKFNVTRLMNIVHVDDIVIHFNTHIFLKRLIDLKCTHSLFFNWSFEGVEKYCNSGLNVSNIYHFSRVPLPRQIDKHWKYFDRYTTVDKIVKLPCTIDCGPWIKPDGISPGKEVSIGCKAVHYFLGSGVHGHEITLAGFSFEGCNNHPWEYESAYYSTHGVKILTASI